VLKCSLPGVSDFYQGTELWDFNLVDPDNRRPVDFELRRPRLERLLQQADDDPDGFPEQLAQRWPDADVKLWVTSRGLNLRNQRPELFTFGGYIPLAATGPAADHVVAFARRFEDEWAVVAVPRQFYHLQQSHEARNKLGIPRASWTDTRIELPEDAPTTFCCAISHRTVDTNRCNGEFTLEIAGLFRVLPVALLVSSSP
jgi:(1->4)-alpha-D-glucan 1-alpha-D-glucosylmutase